MLTCSFHPKEKNPTWGKPARRSHPLRSPSLGCSSRPSGSWRMSFTSLRWSSSSSSALTVWRRKTESCTFYHRTTSMRKSTPKPPDRDRNTTFSRHLQLSYPLEEHSLAPRSVQFRKVHMVRLEQCSFLFCLCLFSRHFYTWGSEVSSRTWRTFLKINHRYVRFRALVFKATWFF